MLDHTSVDLQYILRNKVAKVQTPLNPLNIPLNALVEKVFPSLELRINMWFILFTDMR